MASNANGEGSSGVQNEIEAKIDDQCYEQNQTNKLKDREIEVHRQLWLASAGPMVGVPRVGNLVFYFPQGHIEQVDALINDDSNISLPIYNVPYKILCSVVNVQLQADPNTDEAIAHITLIEKRSFEDKNNLFTTREDCICFTKKLTASDVSAYSGLSIPRRYATQFFPHLDMIQHQPSQDLVVTDLNGKEWRFHHVLIGQPKQHLLIGGWGSFVNSKKLVPGDICIFLRSRIGKLFIGIRRVIKPGNNISSSLLSSQNIKHGILAGAFNAISTGNLFTVHYYPWRSKFQFIIPYDQYMKAAEIEYSSGMKIKMLHESAKGTRVEGTPMIEGTIVCVGDIDHINWPGSEWRYIKVKWDNAEEDAHYPDRVSPWDIEVDYPRWCCSLLTFIAGLSCIFCLNDHLRWR